MSSASEARVLLACALTLVAAAGPACREEAGRPGVASAPPVADVPVGPLPGLEQDTSEPMNPFANDDDALREGRRFFLQYNCAGCHGDHGGGGMGPSLRDAAWIYGSSDARVANSIADGRAHGMPAWSRMLTPAQVWQIAAYIKSMRTPKEPDPPTGN